MKHGKLPEHDELKAEIKWWEVKAAILGRSLDNRESDYIKLYAKLGTYKAKADLFGELVTRLGQITCTMSLHTNGNKQQESMVIKAQKTLERCKEIK